MALGICKNCKKEKKISLSGKTEGLCKVCYKKLLWKPKLIICKRCNREMPLHAKGMCNGCYNSVFHIDKVKMHNAKRYHNIDPLLYKEIIKECVICGFDKIVELHHVDKNHKNNTRENLTGLCPNHHKMIHHRNHRKEIYNILKEKGFNPAEGYKDDEFYKD